MSTIDAAKYDIIRASLNSNFSILPGAGNPIKEGQLIRNGISQLSNMMEYDEESTEDKKYNDANHSTSEENSLDSKNEVTVEESLEIIKNQKEHDTNEMYDNISDIMESNNIDKSKVELSVDPEYNYVKILIDGSILFDSGSANLNPDCLSTLDKVGDILVIYDDYKIEVEGHTDNVPFGHSSVFKDNDELSSARALSAYRYLVNTKKLDPSTFKHSGRGEYDPIASNSTNEGRQKNRRIEIKIYNQLSSY